jgi:uncharacterized membrane protein YfcA
MNGTDVLVAALIVLASGAATAATGFGFNLVSTPLLTLFLPPHEVVVLTLWLGTFASGILLARPHTRANIEWPLMRPLLVSSLPGMPLGAAALVLWDARALRALIAGLTFVFASIMLARIRPRAGASRWGLVGVGIVSGFLSTSTSMNGPLLAFYLVARGVPKERFRANMLVFIFLVSLMSAILLSVRGAIAPDSHGAMAWAPDSG